MDFSAISKLKCVYKLLEIQGNLKVRLMQAGIREHVANQISGDFIEDIKNADDILSEKAKTEINLVIKR